MKITRQQLLGLFTSPTTLTGSNFLGFDSLTNVPLKGGKKNPMQGRVTKLRKGALVFLFTNKIHNAYEGMVNRRLQNQNQDAEKFEVGKLPWGEKIKDTPVIVNKDSYYLQTIEAQNAKYLADVLEGLGIVLLPEETEILNKFADSYQSLKKSEISYFLDGKPIDKKDIEGLETEKIEGEQGGLDSDKKVIVRTYKLESLTKIRFGGIEYEIVD